MSDSEEKLGAGLAQPVARRRLHREASLILLQGAFTVINLLGLYRWVQF